MVIGIPKDAAEGTLSRILHKLHSNYVRRYNKAAGREGPLFSPRTVTPCIHDPEYLVTAVVYVHFNPVRAELCESPDDWEYSSHKAIATQGREGLYKELVDLDPSVLGIEGFEEVTAEWLDREVAERTALGLPGLKERFEKLNRWRCKLVLGPAEYRAEKHEALGLRQLTRGPWALSPG